MTPGQDNESAMLLIGILTGGFALRALLMRFIDRWADCRIRKIEAERDSEIEKLRLDGGRFIAKSVLAASRRAGSAALGSPQTQTPVRSEECAFFVQEIDVAHRPAVALELCDAHTGAVVRGTYWERNAREKSGTASETGSDPVLRSLCLAAASGTALTMRIARRKETGSCDIFDVSTAAERSGTAAELPDEAARLALRC